MRTIHCDTCGKIMHRPTGEIPITLEVMVDINQLNELPPPAIEVPGRYRWDLDINVTASSGPEKPDTCDFCIMKAVRDRLDAILRAQVPPRG